MTQVILGVEYSLMYACHLLYTFTTGESREEAFKPFRADEARKAIVSAQKMKDRGEKPHNDHYWFFSLSSNVAHL